METFLKKHRYLKRCLTRCCADITETSDTSHLVVLSESLCGYFGEFKENFESLMLLLSDEEFEKYQDEFDEFQRSYEIGLSSAKGRSRKTNSISGSIATDSSSCEIKLPPLELPVFRGTAAEWPSFVDLFNSAVGSHAQISPAQKLQYLKSSMRGEAANIIRHLPTTDAAYEEAWTLLKTRFENCREIINSHLKRLFQHENISGNPISLRRLLDVSNECRNALEILKQSKEDAIFNFILWEKLDPETKRSWELSLKDDKIPKHIDMIQFLEHRARALINENRPQEKQNVSPKEFGHLEKPKCAACRGNHFSFVCEKFLQASVKERETLVKAGRLCFNCLRASHGVNSCTSRGCKKCKKHHHTLLHKEFSPAKTTTANFSSSDSKNFSTNSTTLLATAIINVEDKQGRNHKARSLLDLGSSVSFVTEDFANTLGTPRTHTNLSWTGVGGHGRGQAKFKINIKASSTTDENFDFQLDAFIINKITGSHPTADIRNTEDWSHIRNLRLADPDFYKSRNIDLLLGVDVLPHLMKDGILKGRDDMPVAQNTALGWVLFGSLPQDNPRNISSFHISPTLETYAKRFWEIEDFGQTEILNEEEQACEDFFVKTVRREPNGRYVVKLPFKENHQTSDNKSIAFQRFMSLENKFKNNPSFRKDYVAAIQDFRDKGHLILAKHEPDVPKHYLPHHAVLKPDHATTKLRVVFDASAKTKDGSSLNEALMNGPKLQDNLFDILLRFRKHQIVFTADIEKMYRQINLDSSNFNHHRVFWRENFSDPIQEFCLTTVTFGVKPAPFLATRVLKQLAEDEGHRFPAAKEILQNDFYVDDLLSGTNSTTEAEIICTQLNELLKTGGFTLRKWASNNPTIFKGISPDKISVHKNLSIDEGDFIKTLGIIWNPANDSFLFKIHEDTSKGIVTKRKILSYICRTFDPLGWLAPFTITGKIIFQDLWKESLGWDEPVSNKTLQQWTTFKKETQHISKIIIPRKIIAADATDLTLCGFADASEKAYSAVVYLKSASLGKIHVNLVAAKTRVAPLKPTTIPRLELNAALLLAKLMHHVSQTLKIKKLVAWTDSTIVLSWIRGDPAKWKPYVAHRVLEIQEILLKQDWHHVSSENNPADCASRGVGGLELLENNLWWDGPQFLYQDEYVKIVEPQPQMELVKEELRAKSILTNHVNTNNFFNELMHKFSSYSKLLRVTAYIHRFVAKCKKENIIHTGSYISCKEIQDAEIFWMKFIQKEYFLDEYKSLRKGIALNKSSKLLTLNPFVDDVGLLRVGGRLNNAPIGFQQKHPVLLPHKSFFTTLLVRHFHILNCHAGCSALLGLLRRKYWILNGKNLVRKIIIECLNCHRLKAKGAAQKMADLPLSRVTPKPAFNTCGVDYAGPISLKSMTGRKTTHKGYIAVFVCFSTKAIHLELVSSLTTQAFIAALRRFVGRRGLCHTIYSDCGTNFVGANKELQKMLKLAAAESRNEEIVKALSEQGIQWRFNPPSSPHFGGLWEAGVKSVKTHLHRILGKAILNFEEMATVLSQIEACLNSRPLSEISSDPSDLEVLTPGHFLIGRPLNAVPEPDLTNQPENRLARFQLCQKLVQNFWKRWSMEYMSRLQNRPKWMAEKSNLTVGQLVLLVEDNMSPLFWKLGRIIELHPGADGLVRVVSVRTLSGTKKRCVQKIAPLPLQKTDY